MMATGEGRLRAQSGSFQSPFYEFTTSRLSLNFFQYVNNITDFPKALGNSATIAGVVRKRLRAPLELRLCLASFRGMMDFVFKPSLRLVRDVTVCALDDAAEFDEGPRLPHRRDRV